jgi:integrase
MQSLRARRRRPLKPATLHNWQNCLDKWLLPALGDTPLAQVGNAALRMLVDKMQAAGLAPKTIVNYSQVVKLVLASALNAEGEQLYPRKWNHDFIGMPLVLVSEQRRPTLTSEQVAAILARAESPYRVLFALLAGAGLRIGEALALKASDFSSDFKSLEVRRSMWRGREQSPKTPSAVRVVDLAEPLATLLGEYAAGKAGYLFAFANGTPMVQRHALYKLHAAAVGKVGLHAFRRFRTSVLRKARVPEDLIALWLGHSGRSVTDTYARQLREDVPFRQEWAERAGLGYVGLQNVVAIDSVRAA